MPRLRYLHWNDDLDPQSCISVDGTPPGRINLSHWPGNRTPERFRHDLSTGMCLKLAEAPDRVDLLDGISNVTNNHYDTDGACSVFACVEPALALARAPTLLEAAAAGDFSLFTTPEGVKIDLTLTELTRHADSPVASSKFTDDLERRQKQYEHVIQLLPKLLANPDLHAAWFAREFWTIQQDLRALREEDADAEILHSLDLAIVSTGRPLHETAVNTSTGCDRILTILDGPGDTHLYELRMTTLSWFHMQSRHYKPRLLWDELAERLNKEAPGEGQWSADDISDPTPRLAFVIDDELAPNATRPELVRRIVAEVFTRNPPLPAGI
jgi:hypothetical protein